MSFKYPYILNLLVLIPVIIIYYIYTRNRYKSGVAFPSIKVLKKITKFRLSNYTRHIKFALKLSALCILIIAAARPQGEKSFVEKEVEVVDIMLVVDISESMNTMDMGEKTRFKIAKGAISKFISRAKESRLGLIAFAGETYTLVPLTTDYSIINIFLDELAIGDLRPGTAIGMALANASERLKKSKAKSKAIVLLTDGENTAGSISPQNGMEMAKDLDIKIYTIAIGGNPVKTKYYKSPYNVNTSFLEQAAKETGGKFYRVFTNKELAQVYREIGKLEKTKVKYRTLNGRVEYFKPLVLLALCLLLVFLIIDNILLRVYP